MHIFSIALTWYVKLADGEGIGVDPRILGGFLEAAEATADGIRDDLAEAITTINNVSITHATPKLS